MGLDELQKSESNGMKVDKYKSIEKHEKKMFTYTHEDSSPTIFFCLEMLTKSVKSFLLLNLFTETQIFFKGTTLNARK